MAQAAAKNYENVISDLLTSGTGVAWKTRERTSGTVEEPNNSQWIDFSLKLTMKKDGAVPVYDRMEPWVLYVSLNPNFPMCEMMYKTEQGCLMLLQVTRQKNPIKMAARIAWEKCMKQIAMPSDKLHLVKTILIPHPQYANEASLTVKNEKEVSANVYETDSLSWGLRKYEVWKIPANYERNFNSTFHREKSI